jgi:hypothetical protein
VRHPVQRVAAPGPRARIRSCVESVTDDDAGRPARIGGDQT